MNKLLVCIYPSGSCLVKALVESASNQMIEMQVFDSLEAIKEFATNERIPNYIVNMTRPKDSTDPRGNYTQSTKSILEYLDAFPNVSRPFYVLASTVGVKANYINLGDRDQLEYNADRAQAEREFLKSNTSGLILRIPMVPCRDDSLLKRFKHKITTEKDLTNTTLKIPVMPVTQWANDTLAFMTSFNLAKEIQLNTLVIDYKSSDYSIETLQNSLANSTIFDHLLK